MLYLWPSFVFSYFPSCIFAFVSKSVLFRCLSFPASLFSLPGLFCVPTASPPEWHNRPNNARRPMSNKSVSWLPSSRRWVFADKMSNVFFPFFPVPFLPGKLNLMTNAASRWSKKTSTWRRSSYSRWSCNRLDDTPCLSSYSGMHYPFSCLSLFSTCLEDFLLRRTSRAWLVHLNWSWIESQCPSLPHPVPFHLSRFLTFRFLPFPPFVALPFAIQ